MPVKISPMASWSGRTALLRALMGAAGVVVFAIICARFVLGRAPLDIHDLHWIWGDLAQVYIAWSQYLSDPNVHWLSSTRLSYPQPLSISLFDPMPVLLLLARPFATLVQPGTQYLGYYFVACLVLQGVFGYMATLSALRLLGSGRDNASIVIAMCTGILFASVPFTFYRFQGHTALSSQWVLVLSIFVALASIDWGRRAWCMANAGVLFLATGLNPYLALLVLISAGTVTVVAWRGLRTKEVVLRIAVMLAVTAIGLWVFGFMGGATADSGGYGDYSMNLLGPVDSDGLARLLSLDVPDATGHQHFEGYTYVGLGVLLLGLIGVATSFGHRRSPTRFPFVSAMLIILCCTLLALSSTVTVGRHVLEIPLPKAIIFLLSRFRGSGRLFWMAGFWLIVASVAACTRRLGTRRTAVALVALALIQVVDVRPIGTQVRKNLASGNALHLQGIPAASYSAILVYPAWQCDPQGTPGGGVRNYEAVGYFSAERHIPTNNFYAARTPSGQVQFHCDYAARLRDIDSRAVYLLSGALFDQYGDRLRATHTCSTVENEHGAWKCLPGVAR